MHAKYEKNLFLITRIHGGNHMKGIFKQALSITLLLSVATSSVFASEPVVITTPATTT